MVNFFFKFNTEENVFWSNIWKSDRPGEGHIYNAMKLAKKAYRDCVAMQSRITQPRKRLDTYLSCR
jgi:hypothetical protein